MITKPLKIGSVTLANRLVLAPMAGITDLPFRLLCSEMGAGMVCAEMVSAKAICYGNKNTMSLLRTSPAESVVSMQLFGSDPKFLAEAVRRIDGIEFDILDFNMGCPVPKIVNNGEGSALMKDPHLAEKIFAALVGASRRPVTVKLRKAFSDEYPDAAEFARIAESCGIAAVAVHGRTREQYYSGDSDWDIIRKVKEAVRIPVIGSGDITCAGDVSKMQDETGCDAFMIGRAARGNPWIFREILAESVADKGEEAETAPGAAPESKQTAKPSTKEIADMIMRHARLLVEEKGEYVGIREMRKHAAWYARGMRGAADFRREASTVTTLDELYKIVNLAYNAGLTD